MGNANPLASEETGIDRPGAGAEHGEGSPERGQYDVHGGAAKGEKQKTQLGKSHERARDRRPKPYDQKRRTDGRK